MNHESTENHDFDARLRALHCIALGATSPPTLARLRQARRQADLAAVAHGQGRRWLLVAVPLALAVAFGLRLMPDSTGLPQPAADSRAAVTTLDAAIYTDADPLEENPDLYVWLGSTSLAME